MADIPDICYFFSQFNDVDGLGTFRAILPCACLVALTSLRCRMQLVVDIFFAVLLLVDFMFLERDSFVLDPTPTQLVCLSVACRALSRLQQSRLLLQSCFI